MKETPIFRNIQHVPKIWGVTYPKAFGSLGVGLLFTTVAFASADRASATQKIGLLVMGIFITAGLYTLSLWLDSLDPLDLNTTAFLRQEFNSQSMSLQRLAFLEREVSTNAVSRSDHGHHPGRAEAGKRPAVR
jgi:hypothetical protein